MLRSHGHPGTPCLRLLLVLTFGSVLSLSAIPPMATPDPNKFRLETDVSAGADWSAPLQVPNQFKGRTIKVIRVFAHGQWSATGSNPTYGAGGSNAPAPKSYVVPGSHVGCLLVKVKGGHQPGVRAWQNDNDEIDVQPPCSVSFRINNDLSQKGTGVIRVELSE